MNLCRMIAYYAKALIMSTGVEALSF